MIPRLLSASTVLLLAAPLAASVEEFPLEGPGFFPPAAQRSLSPAMDDCDSFAVTNGHLVGFRLAPPAVKALDLRGDMAANPISDIALSALPAGFVPEAATANSFTQHLIMAGRVGNEVRVLKSALESTLETNEWEAMPPVPAPAAFRTGTLTTMGEFVLVMDQWSRDGDVTPGGWAANLVQAQSLFRWIEIPRPARARTGHSVLPARGALIIAGGLTGEGDTAGASATTESLAFDQNTFGAWNDLYLPLSPRLTDTVGVSFGSSSFLAPRRPLPLRTGDLPTSMTVYAKLERPDGSRTLWDDYLLAQATAEVHTLLVDPVHSHLLVVTRGEGGGLALSAHVLPKFFPAQVVTERELALRHFERQAVQPWRRSVAETLASARENGRPALLVVTSGQREEDVNLRFSMRTSRYRQMTMNVESTYLDGEAGRAVLAQYGIRETPALLLVDAAGTLLRQHTGSVPTPKDLFDLTGPSRQAAGD